MTSRSIAEFVSYLKSLDVQLFVEKAAPGSMRHDPNAVLDEMRLRCNAPEGTLTPELRQELADRKAELISYLHEQRSLSLKSNVTIQSDVRKTVFPLSFAQQRLWFLYQLAPDNPFYIVPAAIRFKGKLDQVALTRSFQEIVCRHGSLRTKFMTLDGQPVQRVEPDANIQVSVVDLSSVADADRDRISQQLATAEAHRPFNLTTDPLLRVTLLKFDPVDSVLLLTMHHIIADGWSLGVLIRELACCYAAFVEGRSPRLAPLPIQYTDFACWQRNWLQGKVLETQRTYWRKQLHNLPVLHLPGDRSRPAVQTYRGATYPLQLSPTLTQALATLSQDAGTSLFMTLLAAFQTLLYRYTGQEDIAIGSPIANRHRSEIEDLIGFFVNSLVMRSDLSGNPPFGELLERVRTVALEAYEHQDLPFEKLVEELDPDRDLSRNPLFQVAFALQNSPMQPLELPGLTLHPAPLESGSTRFDLEVHLWEPAHGLRSLWQSQEGLSGFIAYSTDLFDRDRIERLAGHFQTLLEGIVANPQTRLSDLPLLTTAEQQQILKEWSRCPLELSHQVAEVLLLKENLGGSPQDLCFHQIFETQVQADPAAIALVSEQGTLTYGELDQRADHLAQILHQLGVQPDTLVGLCVDRSADMVIGILGILKAAGAYVPLDPHYPSDRLQFMLSDTQVPILLTQSWLVERLPRSPAQLVCLDKLTPGRAEQNVSGSHPELADLGSTVMPDNLAYVIYTSGSTGTPKGVLLSHRGLCNVVHAQQQVFQLSRNSRILQFSSLSFDASVFEMALALGAGGTLYIPPQSAQLPGMALVQFLNDNAITHALLTPAVLAVLPAADLPALQVLITGGEACSGAVVDRWAAHRHFFNAYGPTETTIWATVAALHPGDHPLTIGRPVLNTQVYILDANLNPVAVGIPGDLYIGGVGLARGYLNRPALTAERFIEVRLPILDSGLNHEASVRLYKTGDRACYQNDGSIEFLGRVDDQIKIRGFRVELGEIEATLQRHPAIQEAVVIASDESSSNMRLIAYFSLNRQPLQQTILPALQAQQIQQWQTLYNQTYQEFDSNLKSKIQNPKFNITGWHSSYTGEPIPLEQMQAWVSDRVQQILALKPRRVLEIGCGTGLLLFQIAPHCQQYVGTDFSAVSLDSIQQQLEALSLPHVQLLHRMADDLQAIEPASFDVVILNSIVQYFPSEGYLTQVLQQAIQAVVPGGVLFVGDVRSLPLLTAFHSWVQFCRAETGMERTHLQSQVERSTFEEPELAIDPAFFYAVREQFPQIRQVQIRLSRGRHQNEMTQFRYNVSLHLEAQGAIAKQVHASEFNASHAIQTYNWKLHQVTVETIQNYLIENEPAIVMLTNITNSRVHAAVKTANWLRHQDAPKTVGRMREELQNTAELAIDPQDWWDLEKVLPYHVEINWSAQTHSGDYDVLLIRQGIKAEISARVSFPMEQQNHNLPPYPLQNSYTNDPLQANFARQLIPELRQSLRQTLPDYMVPAAFVPLEALPLTVSGKVDRRALPGFSHDFIDSSTTPIIPSTSTEVTLIEIWQELLRLKSVNIHDNFFELGGHSLLATQMTSRIRDVFELELPLKNVFEAPTIAQLAPILEALRDTPSTPQIPPLVRLERSAYRRSRSQFANAPAQSLQVLHPPIASPLHELAKNTIDPLQEHKPELLSKIQNPKSKIQNSSTTSRSPLVPLTLGKNQSPFFCVHPMFGVVFPYLELAHYLGNDRSFYGLQPLGLDGKSTPLNRIEAIAAYYIQAIQTLQPDGPYFLGGWSFGGLVAFEMAQQLTQAGQQIALLAILDTPAPCHNRSFAKNLKFLLGTAFWSTLPFLLDYGALATNRLQSWNTWFSRWQWSTIARLIPEEARLQLLHESAIRSLLPIVYANSQATYRYLPQSYPNRITLFKATEQPDGLEPDSTLGWSTLANDIQLHQVPGNHLSLLKPPHVQTLAQQLGQCLASANV